ncbi:TlpA family protein disulfide reductase [Tenacibaculum jejuense]|uniref:Thiol-disulfide isomerase-like thioredoxin n=1 Tax=Tenacibaculum jejuense TaxID=584609 RepID=A0A238UC69_9FLAO|nr:TlpA disulfide reductase family protein [Tenacibaculum jejuense]SNR16771.1 Thiol-disulfide isomerase-like thioredoxin [Tenacibaculum jejuense]
MKKHITLSNILFIALICLILYKPSRVWFIRQISFSPTVEKAEGSARIFDYNWKLTGLNTYNANFAEFKGKVVFLNFWATWCPPCIAELPYIQDFYNDYKGKVAFVFITSDDVRTLNEFFKKHGYEFPVYQSNHDFPKELPPVTSIPRTFVIDTQGNIRVDKSGSANWNSKSFRKKIDELIAE